MEVLQLVIMSQTRKSMSTPRQDVFRAYLQGSDGKESACNVGDVGSTPGSERSPGDEIGNPLQYSGLENPRDRVAWWARATKSQTRLSK